jgi:hypothetical protein
MKTTALFDPITLNITGQSEFLVLGGGTGVLRLMGGGFFVGKDWKVGQMLALN